MTPRLLFERQIDQLAFSDIDTLRTRGEMEGLFVEFKRELVRAHDIAKTVASFANTHGGHLFLGIETYKDTNTVKDIPGVLRAPQLLDSVTSAVTGHLDPVPLFKTHSVVVDPSPERVVVIVEVPESHSPPHIMRRSGRIYVRRPGASEPVEPIKNRYELEQLYDKGAKNREQTASLVSSRLNLIVPQWRRPPGGPPPSRAKYAVQIILTPPMHTEMFPDLYCESILKKIPLSEGIGAKVNQDHLSIYAGSYGGAGRAVTREGVVHLWNLVTEMPLKDSILGYSDGTASHLVSDLLRMFHIAKEAYGSANYFGPLSLQFWMCMWETQKLLWRQWDKLPELHDDWKGEFKGPILDLSWDIPTAEILSTNRDELLILVAKQILRAFGKDIWKSQTEQ